MKKKSTKQFGDTLEMLKGLDEFLYRCQNLKSSVKNSLVSHINRFFAEHNMDEDSHNSEK